MPSMAKDESAEKGAKKKPGRTWMTVSMTKMQKAAAVLKARQKGLSPTNYARMQIIEGTGYDPKRDPDVDLLKDEEDA